MAVSLRVCYNPGVLKVRGIALITVLLMTSVLAIMLLSLIYASRQRSFTARQFQEKTAALYVAEAGVEAALNALEADNAWIEGFDQEPMEKGPGSYTLEFVEGDPDPWESVNNLAGTAAVDSHLGSSTVPPRSALLVVTGRVGTTTRRIQVLVRGGSSPLAQQALLASGKVHLNGDIAVRGLKTLTGFEEVEAGIHTNSLSESIVWQGEAEDTALVTGTVSSRNQAASSIQLGSGPNDPRVEVGTVEPGAAPIAPPSVDIVREVESRRGPDVTLAGTNPVLPQGDHYHGGNLEVQGDLVLEGGNLFVEGNLKVNGSIIGDGAVYTTGTTRFFGDAKVTSLKDRKVAVYSHGHVHLSGFNGSEFLDTVLAGNQQQLDNWHETQAVVELSRKMVLENEDRVLEPSGSPSAGSTFGQFQDAVGVKLTPSNFGNHNIHFANSRFPEFSELHGNKGVLHDLIAYVEGLPPGGDSLEFMRERLYYLDETFGQPGARDVHDGPYGSHSLFNATMDFGQNEPEAWTEILNRSRILGQGQIGTAYFFGMVYTNGAFYSDNEVSVIGMLVAHDDGSQEGATLDDTAVDVQPGDIYLNQRSSLVFVEELFSDEDPLQGAITELTVEGWLED